MGLFKGLRTLGYKAYHNMEAASRLARDIPIIIEAMEAENNPRVTSFGREELDKLWADYDVSIRSPGTGRDGRNGWRYR